jgi:secreted protein with Ig-like and vWFA domain
MKKIIVMKLTRIEIYQDVLDPLGWWGYRLYFDNSDRWTTDTGLFKTSKEAFLDAKKHLKDKIRLYSNGR